MLLQPQKQAYMYLLKPIFWTYLFCYFAVASHAQSGVVALIAPNLTARTGDSLMVALRLKAVDTLTSVQFSFAWDSTVLQFGRISGENFPPQTGFGLPQNANAGRLTFLWFDPSTRGIRFIDTTQLFLIHFKVIGASGKQSPLQFVHSPTRILASDRRLNPITVNLRQGNFSVWQPNATIDLLTEGGIFWKIISPNPSNKLLPFQFKLYDNQELTLRIISSDGKIFYYKKAFFEAGEHDFLPITEGGNFLPNGIYIYSLQTKNSLLNQKFLLTQ